MEPKTPKEKAEWTYKMIQRERQNKKYEQRRMESDLTAIDIRGFEKTSRRKAKQI